MTRTKPKSVHRAGAAQFSSPAFREAYEAGLRARQALAPRSSLLQPAALALAMAAAFASLPLQLQANPAGGVAVHGAATMVSNGNQLVVTTQNGAGTSHSVINWQSFSIPTGSSTYFAQPGVASTAINRVVANNPSAIFGSLGSNGRLVLVNPAGITVGAGAVVDTAGFTAAAMRLAEDDAKAGRLRFNASGLTGGSAGALSVQGNIIARGGDVVLIAPNAEVAKGAVVESQGGAVALVAGQQVEITGRGLEGIQLQVRAPGDQAVNLGTLRGSAVGIFASTLRHSGLIQATGVGVEGGKVVLQAAEVADVSGRIEARRLANAAAQGGSITVNAGIAVLSGALDARGTAPGSSGGEVQVQADSIIQSGSVDVSGMRSGGVALLQATRSVIQTADASVRADAADGVGGVISVQAGAADGVVLSSATISASGAGDQGTGGHVQLQGASITLQAAEIRADGDADGGKVLVGGDRQGQNRNFPNSRHLYVNAASQLSANSRRRGNGGTVVLWSDGDTRFFGTVGARGAGAGGNGGLLEVSGKEAVQFGGMAEAAGGPGGANGSLLLDPKNITIASSAGGLGVLELADPNAESGTIGTFGAILLNLDTTRVLVTDPTDNAGGTGAGAIYVFNKTTGALQSALTGSHAGDGIGAGSYTYYGSQVLFQSGTWNAGQGAWTFVNTNQTAAPLPSGVVSASNSLVGTAAGDLSGASLNSVITGTALLIAPGYGGGRGAVASIDTNTGFAGTLSATNALVGSAAGDRVGSGGYLQYSNTEWVVKSPSWSSGAGALTFVTAASVGGGVIGASNSLVGSAAGDSVGSGGVFRFDTAGSLLVSSPGWGGGKGAFTVKTTSALAGVVDGISSLVGNITSDGANTQLWGCYSYGYCGTYPTALASYSSYPYPYSGFLAVNTGSSSNGSLSLLTAASPVTGAVSSSNSMVGGNAGDFSGATLAVNSGMASLLLPNWKNGAVVSAGALTFASLSVPAAFPRAISAANSLIGSSINDFQSASLQTYDNGAVSLLLPNWKDSVNTISSAGALTLVWPATPPVGPVSAANSIVGTATGDLSGASIITYGGYGDLAYGNALLVAPNYGGGTIAGKGAVALLALPDGVSVSPVSGNLTSGNALVGGSAGDHVGSGGVDTTQPNYWMIKSPGWGGAGTLSIAKGAVTFFEPVTVSTFAAGVVDGATNSWVGASAGDRVGSDTQFLMLSGDNAVLLNRSWGGGKGAITPVSDLAMPHGTISSATSYVGTTTSDGAGMQLQGFDSSGQTGAYLPEHAVASSTAWNGNRGFVTYINSDFGLANVNLASFGVISSSNSLVGSTAGDRIGSGGITFSSSAGVPAVIAYSPNFNDGGSIASAGAYSFINGTVGSGRAAVSAANSFIGTAANDFASSTLYTSQNAGYNYPYYGVPSGQALLLAPNYYAGKGAVVQFDVGSPSLGSGIYGSAITDHVGSGGLQLLGYYTGKFIVKSPSFASNAGALTYFDMASAPALAPVSTLNSFLGAATGDSLGGSLTSITEYGSKLLVVNKAGVGSMTLVQDPVSLGSAAGLGQVSSSNSLVGSTAGDFASATVTADSYSSGKVFVSTPSWANGSLTSAGAITRIDTSSATSPFGTLGAGTSLVGQFANDGVGSAYNSINQSFDGYYIATTGWNSGVGALTFFSSGSAMLPGAVSASNSLVGTAAGDLNGYSLTYANQTGKRLLAAPNYAGGKGAVSLVNLVAATNGTLDSASNALMGSTATDRIGSSGVFNISGNYFGVYSPSWSSNAGAITVLDTSAALPIGPLSSGNSLIGSAVGDSVGSGPFDYMRFVNGKIAIVTRTWGGGKGAITLLPSLANVKGVVDATTSLVGVTATDGASLQLLGLDASSSTSYYYYGSAVRLVVSSSGFNGGRGMVNVLDSTAAAPVGVISAANSLVGSTAGDGVGNYIQPVYTKGLFVNSYNWSGARGAVTFVPLTGSIAGAVSAANSLVGASAGDKVGINGVNPLSLGAGGTAYSGAYVINPYVGGGKGAVSFIGPAGTTGVVSAANSVLGTVAGAGGFANITTFAEAEALRLRFATGSGRVVYADPRNAGTSAYSGGFGFADSPGSDATITAQTITAITNAGTKVHLQANNDIVVNAAIASLAASGVSAPGSLKLEAGRSILINANIDQGGADLSLIANSQLADGTYRDAGEAYLLAAPGVTLTSSGGFIGALMDSGITRLSGGNIELGNVVAGGLELRNWSTISGAGVRQTAGTRWQTSALRMETRATNGPIGTLNAPISFDARWLAARSRGGPMELNGTAASLAINDVLPTLPNSNSGSSPGSGGGGSTDPRTFDDFFGLTTEGVGSVALRVAGDLAISSQSNGIRVAAQNLSLQARSISISAVGAPVTVVARGALELRSAGDITLQAGSVAGAYASVVSAKNALIVAGGRLGLRGGAGNGAYALIDPTDTGSGMTVNVGSLNIQGGAGSGAYGALVSSGGPLALTAGSVILNAGSGTDADAVILSPNAKDLLASYGGNDLGNGSPLGNGRTDTGFAVINAFSSLQQSAFSQQTLEFSNLLDTFIALWKKEKQQGDSGVVVSGTCTRN